MPGLLAPGLCCRSGEYFAGGERIRLWHMLVRLLSAGKESGGDAEILDVTSIPLAVVALGEADEDPDARGFFDEARVKYL